MVARVKKSAGKTAKKQVTKKASKKAVVKSAVGKSVKKTTTAPARKKSASRSVRDFTPGSDLEVAFEVMCEGGEDRRAVMHKVRAKFEEQGRTTAAGGVKPVSTIMNQVFHRAKDMGYGIQSTWKLAPVQVEDKVEEGEPEVTPAPVKKAAKRVAKRAVKKGKKPIK